MKVTSKKFPPQNVSPTNVATRLPYGGADSPIILAKKLKDFILICVLLTMACGLIGCDAFVRKFTRKPKKEDLAQEEMVVSPEEYAAPVATKEETYRKYFLFWKSWQDELIGSLMPNMNYKKQVDCITEAIKNLQELQPLLDEARKEKLNSYINQLNGLKSSIAEDVYGYKLNSNRVTAEQIRRDILRDFSYNKIKDYLI